MSYEESTSMLFFPYLDTRLTYVAMLRFKAWALLTHYT